MSIRLAFRQFEGKHCDFIDQEFDRVHGVFSDQAIEEMISRLRQKYHIERVIDLQEMKVYLSHLRSQRKRQQRRTEGRRKQLPVMRRHHALASIF